MRRKALRFSALRVLLDAQRTLYGAELDLIGARQSEAANRVALYKALGGGWQ